MTVETSTTIEFCDVHELEIECVGCYTKVSWKPLQDQTFMPTKCSKCGEQFLIKGSVEHKELLQLIATVTRHAFGGSACVPRFAVENGVKSAK